MNSWVIDSIPGETFFFKDSVRCDLSVENGTCNFPSIGPQVDVMLTHKQSS